MLNIPGYTSMDFALFDYAFKQGMAYSFIVNAEITKADSYQDCAITSVH